MIYPRNSHVDGKVWFSEGGTRTFYRLDPGTGKFEHIEPFKAIPRGTPHGAYGIASDAQNNLWFMDFADRNVGRTDKNGTTLIYLVPTPASRDLRGGRSRLCGQFEPVHDSPARIKMRRLRRSGILARWKSDHWLDVPGMAMDFSDNPPRRLSGRAGRGKKIFQPFAHPDPIGGLFAADREIDDRGDQPVRP